MAWLSVPFILFVWSSSWLWGRLLVYVVVLPFVCSSSRVCGRVRGSVVFVLSLSSFGFGGNLILGRIWVLGGLAVCPARSVHVAFALFVKPSSCLCRRLALGSGSRLVSRIGSRVGSRVGLRIASCFCSRLGSRFCSRLC